MTWPGKMQNMHVRDKWQRKKKEYRKLQKLGRKTLLNNILSESKFHVLPPIWEISIQFIDWIRLLPVSETNHSPSIIVPNFNPLGLKNKTKAIFFHLDQSNGPRSYILLYLWIYKYLLSLYYIIYFIILYSNTLCIILDDMLELPNCLSLNRYYLI